MRPHLAAALAAALSLASTGALVILLDAPHPPAGAATLIVSLGALDRPASLAVIEAAVVLLALQAVAFNRLAGLDYPWWKGPPARAAEREGSPGRADSRENALSTAAGSAATLLLGPADKRRRGSPRPALRRHASALRPGPRRSATPRAPRPAPPAMARV